MSTKIKNMVVVMTTACFLCGFAIWGILQPDGTESVSERRPLQAFPAVSVGSVFDGQFMTDFEEYTLDQFPLRDRFRTVKAMTACYLFGKKDNNDVYYLKNGYISKLEYPMNTESIQYAVDRFRLVYERNMADKEMNVYLSVIPDKNYFMARKNGYLSMDYDMFIARMRSSMDFAAFIDVTPLLELSDYYGTDAHWRQEKVVDVARHLAGEMGVALSAEYTKKQVQTPFYGVYYGQLALPLRADKLYYLDNAALGQCSVYDYETNSYIPVYDLEKAKGNDPYEMFLSGSKALLTIKNPAAATDRELIIFRDSFGSCLAPLLAEGYAKITLVDIRYISPDLLNRFISFDHQDVLFLYCTSVLNNSITIK